jgi:hypothetical protein
MASRTARKSATLPTATIAFVRELPGATFFGDGMNEHLAYAVALQRIRARYEIDAIQETLWADLSEMGFDSREISQFVANPAAITNCGYAGRSAFFS